MRSYADVLCPYSVHYKFFSDHCDLISIRYHYVKECVIEASPGALVARVQNRVVHDVSTTPDMEASNSCGQHRRLVCGSCLAACRAITVYVA